MAIDAFGDNPTTGSFLVVDAITGATLAGGVVSAATAAGETTATSTFRLTREILEKGLCRDLSDTKADRDEFQRRASEAALLLRAAGVPVKLET